MPAQAPSGFDRRVYDAIAAYAWDEAECHPSQSTIARDIGCTREAVNRVIRRLIDAGWLAIIDRRWSPRTRWVYNVYELYEHFTVGALTIKRVVRRAHRRRNRWAAWQSGTARNGSDHTNAKRSTPLPCSCGWCVEDRPASPEIQRRAEQRSLKREGQRRRERKAPIETALLNGSELPSGWFDVLAEEWELEKRFARRMRVPLERVKLWTNTPDAVMPIISRGHGQTLYVID